MRVWIHHRENYEVADEVTFLFVMILIHNLVSCNLQFIHNPLNINFNIVLLVIEGDFIQNLVLYRLAI